MQQNNDPSLNRIDEPSTETLSCHRPHVVHTRRHTHNNKSLLPHRLRGQLQKLKLRCLSIANVICVAGVTAVVVTALVMFFTTEKIFEDAMNAVSSAKVEAASNSAAASVSGYLLAVTRDANALQCSVLASARSSPFEEEIERMLAIEKEMYFTSGKHFSAKSSRRQMLSSDLNGVGNLGANLGVDDDDTTTAASLLKFSNAKRSAVIVQTTTSTRPPAQPSPAIVVPTFVVIHDDGWYFQNVKGAPDISDLTDGKKTQVHLSSWRVFFRAAIAQYMLGSGRTIYQGIDIGFADRSYVSVSKSPTNSSELLVTDAVRDVMRFMGVTVKGTQSATSSFSVLRATGAPMIYPTFATKNYDPSLYAGYNQSYDLPVMGKRWLPVRIVSKTTMPVLPLTSALYNSTGYMLGVATFTIPIADFNNLLKTAIIGSTLPTGSVAFLTYQTYVIATSLDGRPVYENTTVDSGYVLTPEDITAHCELQVVTTVAQTAGPTVTTTLKLCPHSITTYDYAPLQDFFDTIAPAGRRATDDSHAGDNNGSAPETQAPNPNGEDGGKRDAETTAPPTTSSVSAEKCAPINFVGGNNVNYFASVSNIQLWGVEGSSMAWRVVVLSPSPSSGPLAHPTGLVVIVTVAMTLFVAIAFSVGVRRLLRPLLSVAQLMTISAYLADDMNALMASCDDEAGLCKGARQGKDDSSISQSKAGNRTSLSAITVSDGYSTGKSSPPSSASAPFSALHVLIDSKRRNEFKALLNDRDLSCWTEVKAIQASYWSMSDELGEVRAYVPEHLRQEILTANRKWRDNNTLLLLGLVNEATSDTSSESNLSFEISSTSSSVGPHQFFELCGKPPSSTGCNDGNPNEAQEMRTMQRTSEVQSSGVSELLDGCRVVGQPTEAPSHNALLDGSASVDDVSAMVAKQEAAPEHTSHIFFADNALVDRDISVVHINIIRFHSHARAQGANTISKDFSAFITYLHQEARRFGGVLESFSGDKVWVSFNATCKCDHSPVAAAYFAFHVANSINMGVIQNRKPNPTQLRSESLGSRESASTLPEIFPCFSVAPFGISCGAATGRAFVGPLGNQSIKRHAIISNAYSEAAALERQALRYPGCSALVGGSMLPLIDGYCQYALLDATLLPGSECRRRRIACLKGPMVGPGFDPTVVSKWLPVTGNNKPFVVPSVSRYRSTNEAFNSFLEGNTDVCRSLLATAREELELLEYDERPDERAERRAVISLMAHLLEGLIASGTDGRLYRSDLGEAFAPFVHALSIAEGH